MSERNPDRYDALARALIDPLVRQPTPLTGTTTPGGLSDPTQDQAWVNPMDGPNQFITSGPGGTPLKGETGTEGQVITIVGGVLVFADAPSGSGGRYRALLYELDGAGGFDFLIDEDGHPVYELTELE